MIEDFFVGTGVLAIVGIIGYLYLKNLDNKSIRKKENRLLINYSDKCKELSNNCDNLSEYEFDKKLDKILNTSGEREAAIEKKKIAEIKSSRYNEQEIQRQKESRKFGYKYETDIFEIFDIDVYLTKIDFLLKMQKHYNIDSTKADNLLKLWKKNSLIYDSKDVITVGLILTSDCFALTDSDLTREKWLEMNNKLADYRQNIDRDMVSRREKQDNERRKLNLLIDKYKKDIFIIFSIDNHTKDTTLRAIQGVYNMDESSAIEVFNIWVENYLIKSVDNESSRTYRAGAILGRNTYL